MFEGERMIHEGRMQIRLRRVAGVTRFGEEAQVGELKTANDILFQRGSR